MSESISITEDDEYAVIDVSQQDTHNHVNNPIPNPLLKWNNDSDLLTLPIPKLSILMLVVGTKGDVQPFVLLGRRLMRDGHRIRLATHACYRNYVTDEGLEFYPLAGDPYKLSEFMVKTHGTKPAYSLTHSLSCTLLHSLALACTRLCVY